ncbi:AAA family ATPase [Nocardia sp. NPDC050630]|uniref:AAA family ATPase n=1 Tax=Nocardia sp. NPDC050630 TaxID=3364321 RepID=UPI003787D37D
MTNNNAPGAGFFDNGSAGSKSLSDANSGENLSESVDRTAGRAVVPFPDQKKPSLRDQILSIGDLAELEPAAPLIDEFLYTGTLAQLSAPAGSYKSFLAVGWACALALGQSWEGYRVPKAERVLYVAAEGVAGLLVRILAWCELSGVDPIALRDELFILPRPVQLGNINDVAELCQVVEEMRPGLVVLDTRAKCTVGLDENSATEQGKAIAAVERVMDAAKCSMLVIHHAGRQGSNPRGSTAWDGGVWSDLRMEGSELRATVRAEKHKDAPSGRRHDFRLVPHTVSEKLMPGFDEEQRRTLVLIGSDGAERGSSQHEQWIKNTLREYAGEDGLSRSDLVKISTDHESAAGPSEATIRRTLRKLAETRVLTNIGTRSRPRYVLVGS